jgi:membrane protease YdiL (CAAX protease family)
METANLSGSASPKIDSTRSRLIIIAELILATALFVLPKFHLLPRPDTLWLLLLGWISLRLRKSGWKSVGLTRPASWPRTIVVALVAAVVLQAVSLWITVPLATRLTGKPPDLTEFRELIGNTKLLLIGLGVVWTLAAFGEELAFRGYLLNRVADLGGRSRAAWAVAYIVMSAVFGLGHLYQGPSGVIDSAVAGLMFGGLYLALGRNLWPAILAHGMSDTLALVMVYCGWTPGVKI